MIATKMASSPCFSLHLSLKEEQPAQSKSQSIRGNTRNTKNPKKCTNIREKHRFMKIQNAATNTKIQVLANEGTSNPAKSKSQFKQKGIWIQIFLPSLEPVMEQSLKITIHHKRGSLESVTSDTSLKWCWETMAVVQSNRQKGNYLKKCATDVNWEKKK